MQEIEFRHKDIWTYRSNTFAVEVSRHAETRIDGNVDNMWCIYAYVWEKHPAFRMFNRDGKPFDQPAFEVHSYPSFYRPHINNAGGVTAHQIGWDYNHDGDCQQAEQAASQYMDWDSDAPAMVEFIRKNGVLRS